MGTDMTDLNKTLSNQFNQIRSNSVNSETLILVNYMPVMCIMRPYQQITEEEVEEYKKIGYPEPVSMIGKKHLTKVPYIKRVPAYCYFIYPSYDTKKDSQKTLFRYSRDTQPMCVFKPGPTYTSNPTLIKIETKNAYGEVDYNYYINPNIVPLDSVLRNYHKISDMFVYCNDTTSGNWTLSAESHNLVNQEIPYYNYVTEFFSILRKASTMDSSTLEQYDPLISKLKDGVTVNDALKLYHTHLLRASTELGHYYSTFRHKSGVNSNLDYYYNNEFVPIYYGLGLPCITETLISNISFKDIISDEFINIDECRLIDLLFELFKSDALLQISDDTLYNTLKSRIKSIDWDSVPDCSDIVVYDDDTYRSVKYKPISPSHKKVYYITRKDLAILTDTIYSPEKSDMTNTKDMYQYRAIMPYLVYSLLLVLDSLVAKNDITANLGNKQLSSYIIPPTEWTYTFYESPSSKQFYEEAIDNGMNTAEFVHEYLIVPSYSKQKVINNNNNKNIVTVFSNTKFINYYYNLRGNIETSSLLFVDSRYEDASGDNVFINQNSIIEGIMPFGTNTTESVSDLIAKVFLGYSSFLRNFFSKGV